MRPLATLLTILTLSGCRGDDECKPLPEDPEFAPLIDHAAWEFTPAEEDPLVDHRPSVVDCGIAGWYVQKEGEELEIDTNFCNYASLRQSSLRAIDACSTLRINLYHFDLVAPEPAQAHAAVLIDGQVVWEEFMDIPGGNKVFKATVYEVEFAAPFAAPAGSEVTLHLHNHGQNTWTLLSIGVFD